MNKSTSKTSKKRRKLNPKQELFCKIYATDRKHFGNGLTAYAEAYGLDLSQKKDYATAKTNASKLLTNTNILERTRELMELGVLNDERVDRELSFLIEQDVELRTKLGAISEYNKLKARIHNKLELDSSNIEIKISRESVDD